MARPFLPGSLHAQDMIRGWACLSGYSLCAAGSRERCEEATGLVVLASWSPALMAPRVEPSERLLDPARELRGD